LARLNDKKAKLSGWLTQIEVSGDARPLDACYNVQTVADAKHKLIVDFDVSICPDDKGILLDRISLDSREIRPRKIHKARCIK
jgi:hypothetical protein